MFKKRFFCFSTGYEKVKERAIVDCWRIGIPPSGPMDPLALRAGNRILRRLFPDQSSQLGATRVLNKLAAGNALLRNMGDGTFKDVSADVGPFSAGWAFGGGFVDFDNDGWEDLHAPNGFISGKSLKDT